MQLDSASTIPVPTRQQLIDGLNATNRSAWPILAFQVLLIAACAWAIDWKAVQDDPLVPTIGICFMVGPFVMGILQHAAQKKKEVDQLQEHTRFGQYDKHLLRKLYNETLLKLNLPNERLPLYITANRQLNAFSMHVGLGSFIKSLNGVYLNRQVLHKLEPDEVQDIIGHELGHYYRYYIVADRFRIVTLLLGALVGVLAAQWIGLSNILGYVVLSVCATGFWRLSMLPYARHGQAIEYLCDDHGAQVHGVAVSISGLMKIGADSEVHREIQYQALQSTKSGKLAGREVIEAIESAIPYGYASREELEKAVEQALKRRREAGPSLGGFLQYMWNSERDADIDEQLQEEAAKHKILQSIPRIDWESLLVDPQHVRFERSNLEQLVEAIERQPKAQLFRIPEELGGSGDVHPPLKQRILYLWRNRQEIEHATSLYNR